MRQKTRLLLITPLWILVLVSGTALAQNTSPYWSLSGNSNAGASSKLGTTNATSLRIYANNVQRMIVNYSNGHVGIGTATPTERLHVNSASGASVIRAQVNGNTKFLVHGAGGVAVGGNVTPPTNGLYVAGRVGVGTTSPSNELHVVGRGRFTNGMSVVDGGTYSSNSSGYGVEGNANPTDGIGVYGSGYNGIYGSGKYYGVYGFSGDNYGVYGSSGYTGVQGSGTSYGGVFLGTGSGATGLHGSSSSGFGVYGISTSTRGVYGYSNQNTGGYFYSVNGNGVWGRTTSTTSGTYAGVFEGNVYTFGVYTSSDETLKKNIGELENAMSLVGKLKPRHYEFVQEGDKNALSLPKGLHYGFIAQELGAVLPHLINEAPQGMGSIESPVMEPKPGDPHPTAAKSSVKAGKAINYIELIPLLVGAMQEQQAEIVEIRKLLKAQGDELAVLKGRQGTTRGEILSAKSAPSLGQNAPNPFSTSTVISYQIPPETRSAAIVITNMKGGQVRQLSIANRGKGVLELKSGTLAAGTYQYTLYLDGRKGDTKQFIIAR